MSSAAEGWYVDPSTGTNLRWWSGSTWTDEVAPLPYEPAHSDPVDLFAGGGQNPVAAGSAVADRRGQEHPAADALPRVSGRDETEPGGIDPEIELTLLTRRELRARRGDEEVPDDTPKHLPPMTQIAAMSIGQWMEPAHELEIPAPSAPRHEGEEPDAAPGRRRRIVRMSVLLGVLAVATSVAMLTIRTM